MKAQAALEFLMTYAWAIVVILVIVGALAFLGVFDVSKKLPEQALFPMPITAVENALIYGNGTVRILMMNGAGQNIVLSSVGFAGTNDCSNISSFEGIPTIVGPNEKFEARFNCGTLTKSRFRSDLSFRYNNSYTNINHMHSGAVSGPVIT